jgi:hypothetical protein
MTIKMSEPGHFQAELAAPSGRAQSFDLNTHPTD